MKFFYIPAPPDIENCIFKLMYGTKFVIIKAKNVKATCSNLQKGINQFLRGSDPQHKKDNLYIHLYNYIQEHPDKELSVKVIVQNDNIYQLLSSEYLELEKNRNNKNCLNNNIEPYIPQFNEDTGMYGWIPKMSYLHYRKWLKRHKFFS
jgi:hypothetical protein